MQTERENPTVLSGEKQQRIQESLLELHSKYGHITARHLVEEARNPNHRMHGDFDWDTDRAAERWWLHQAEMYICSVRVEFTGGGTFRANVNVKFDDGNRGFVPVEEAIKNQSYREQMLMRALVDLRSIRTKYQELKELAKVFEAIEEAEKIAAPESKKDSVAA